MINEKPSIIINDKRVLFKRTCTQDQRYTTIKLRPYEGLDYCFAIHHFWGPGGQGPGLWVMAGLANGTFFCTFSLFLVGG